MEMARGILWETYWKLVGVCRTEIGDHFRSFYKRSLQVKKICNTLLKNMLKEMQKAAISDRRIC